MCAAEASDGYKGRLREGVKRALPGWVLDRLRTLMAHGRLRRFRKQLATFPARKVHQHFGGVPLEVWITDPVAELWYPGGWPVMNDVEFLRRSRLKAGARVFDLGAHQCILALILAYIVGPEGEVVAVEANPHNAAVGARNRDLNHAARLEVINAAVGERTGTVSISERSLNCKVGEVDSASGIDVKALTIDDLTHAHGPPDVIFLDVEGFECHALRGARQTLAGRPDLLIEVHVGCGIELFGESAESLLPLIPVEGYELFFALERADGFPGEFTPFRRGQDQPKVRFFLAAMHT